MEKHRPDTGGGRGYHGTEPVSGHWRGHTAKIELTGRASELPEPARLKMSTEQLKAEADLETLRSHRDAILQVARRRKATNVRVFGSRVRGAAQKASDMDFLVSMAPDATLLDLIGLEQDLEALLGREVDVVTDDESPTRFQEEVRRTAMRL